MGAHASMPDKGNISSRAFTRGSHAYPITETGEASGKEKKKKMSSKFATLRKKLIRVRRHSRSLDHGKAMRDMLSTWSIQDVASLVNEFEATAALKELSLAASLARPTAHSLRHDLSRLYDCKFCTDIDLIFKNSCFPAHRAILSARSPFFKSLLSRYPEYGAQIPVRLKTPGVDVELFSALLRYLYTDELGGEDINLENNELLGRLAGEFGVPNVIEHDMKQLLDSAELSDAVLVFASDSDHGDLSNSQSALDSHPMAQSMHGPHRPSRFEFPCHKAIIASRSPFFRNLINRRARSGEELTERTLRTPSRIVLDETVIPRRYARVLLGALYQDTVDMSCVLRGSPSMCSLSEIQAMVSTGRCQMTVVDEAMELYQIGQFLDSQVIAQGCEDIIMDHLTPECLFSVLSWSAEPHGSKWVHRQAFSYLTEEFLQISQSPVLYDLSKEYLKEALSSDFLQCGEQDVLAAVLKWGEHQLVKRIEEREPNLLSHTAHSVAKKGVKKRDLNDAELRDLLSDVLPLLRVQHVIPSHSEVLVSSLKRGLVESPTAEMSAEDAMLHRIGAWTGLTDSGLFLKPRLYTPYYEEAKNVLEELTSQGQESGSRVRALHMSAIPDTLYMLEDRDVQLPLPYSGSPVSTVDVIAGTIPVPDRSTFIKMLEREQELMSSKIAQRINTLPCGDKRSLTLSAALSIQLRVVREFGLPDSAVEVLQNSQYYYTSGSHRRRHFHPPRCQQQQQQQQHQQYRPQIHFRCSSEKRMSPEMSYRTSEREPCSESILSDVMPDIALASASLSQIHLHEEAGLELDIGDGSIERQATLYI